MGTFLQQKGSLGSDLILVIWFGALQSINKWLYVGNKGEQK